MKTWSSETYPVEYGYDDQGRQITLTTWQDFDSASGAAVTTWVYDSQRGWLNRKEYDDGNGTDYTYTPGGRLASRIWARGADTHYAYTPMGELWAVNYIDAENTPDVIYEYTRTGNRKKVVDGQFGVSPFGGNAFPSTAPVLATERYAYEYGYRSDLLPDTEKISGLMSFDGTLTRTYQTGSGADSVAGRSAGYEWVANAATNTVTYAYDLAGRLEDVSDGVDTFTYGYHATNGNLLASVSGPVHDVVYEYESGRNAMKAVKNTETVGTNTLVSRYAYTYNELGQRVDRTQTGGAVTSSVDTFAYDDLGQVTSSTNDVYTTQNAWNPSYSYDDIGNRAGTTTDLNGSKDYTANLLNQYTDIGTPAVQPSYDDDGNMTDDGTGWTFTWNGENRLIEATDGTTTLEFEYDYQGRLIKKTENGLSEMYVYDGWNRIATYAGGTLQETNLWGLDLSGSLQGAGGVGGLLKEGGMYPLYDANGNIMQKLDSNGNALMSVTYDPFGNLIDGTLVGDYGFSTKPLVQGVEWYYYGFRYYDPETGRWPNRDPIEEEGGYNLYGFVGNDGVNRWDLLGMVYSENVETDSLSNIQSQYGVLAYTGANQRGLVVPEIVTPTEHKLKEEGCCVTVEAAQQVAVVVKTVLPNDAVGVRYTLNGFNEVRGHEDRRRQVYRLAHDAYIDPISETGTRATRCEKICRETLEEAKSVMLKYLQDNQSLGITSFNNWVLPQQVAIGRESRTWILRNGLRHRIGSVYNVPTPPPLADVPCPSEN